MPASLAVALLAPTASAAAKPRALFDDFSHVGTDPFFLLYQHG